MIVNMNSVGLMLCDILDSNPNKFMFNLQLNIINPWFTGRFKALWSKSIRITRNKTFEIEMFKYGVNLLGFEINVQPRGKDHAGAGISLTIFMYTLIIGVHDNRHWDYSTNTWEKQ